MDNWGFVVAAYGITVAVILGYVVVLRARLRAAESELERANRD
jgi:CcmD family protein